MRVLGFLLFSAALLHAEMVEYQIAPAEGTRFALEVFKTGLMRGKKHLFLFERYSGKLWYDAEKTESSRVELTIEAGSATLKDTWLSPKDFKKVQEYALKDMLAAERYPELSFVSTSIRATAANQYEVQGTLSIRGTAKPARVLVSLKPGPTGTLAFEGSTQLKMTDYGLKPPSAGLGTVGTKNEMAVSFSVVGHGSSLVQGGQR